MLIMIGEHFFLLEQIDILKKEIISLKENQQNMEEKTSILNLIKNPILILGGIAFTAIILIYFGGIDPGDLGKGLNSIGNQMTHLTEITFKNMSDKLTEVNSSNIEHIGRLSEQLAKIEEKLSKLMIQISNQIINLDKSPINPKTLFSQFPKPRIE